MKKNYLKSEVSEMVASPFRGGREGLNIDSYTHLRGESVYLDDIPMTNGTLFCAVFDSPIAHGKIKLLDTAEATTMAGIVRIFTAADIPGENQIGGIIPDEELLANTHVHFCGMPIALVVATSDEAARAAIKKLKVEIDPLPIITDPREAKEKGELIIPPRTFQLGDTTNAWSECDYIFEGQTETNGQEHLYIETQGAYAVPQENGAIKVYSSTQGPTAVQRTVARVLSLPMNQVAGSVDNSPSCNSMRSSFCLLHFLIRLGKTEANNPTRMPVSK